ncbi:MAG: M20 family metallopeptidase [Deltaproteobacteria bacterium]|nr:M20 family metallopeptidase [Deltaproteobacteria bacterium]
MANFKTAVESLQEDILKYLTRMVNMESPSHEKSRVDAVIDVLEASFRHLGFRTRRLPQRAFGNHLVADMNEGQGPRILLVGHADTVYPLGTLERMPLKKEGNLLMGPGVQDMKGGLTVMLFGTKIFLDAAGSLEGAIRIVVNSDEEPGSPTSRNQWKDLVQDVDYAMIFEPAKSDGAMVYRRKGVGIFKVDVTGKAAHAGAEPEKGASAIRVLAQKILDIESLADPRCGTTVNTGVIEGGTEPYVVPESAGAKIDIRIPSIAEKNRILKSLQSIVQREDLPGTRAKLSGQFHRPPMEPAEGFESFRHLVEQEGQALGLCVLWADITGGASDGNNISALAVPTIDGMGPSGGGAHSPEEYMDISSLFHKTALLAAVLNRIVGKK